MSIEALTQFREKEKFVPFYQGKASEFLHEGKVIPIHKGKTEWTFEYEGELYNIPVYSIWDYNNHKEIATQLAQGKVCAMYMWGTYGTGVLVNSPEWPTPLDWGINIIRNNIKIGRPEDMPYIPFMYPDDMIDFWDTDGLHKDYRNLQWAGARQKLYESGPVHIIARNKSNNPHLDSRTILSKDQTTSYFFMPHPAWERVVKMLRKAVRHAVFAGGSLNVHGEAPAYTTRQLHTEISLKPGWIKSIGLIVTCEISEGYDINRGQTQIRLPQSGSDGICHVVRVGAMNPLTWANSLGYRLKDAPEGIKFASSKEPYTIENHFRIDTSINESREAMKEFDEMQKKLI